MNNSKGIDLSHYQTVASFHDIAAVCQFCYLKATEGTGFTDPTFADYRTRAASVGLRVGAYHFLHPTDPVGNQVAYFQMVVGDLKPGELAPAIDVESTPGWTAEGIEAVNHFAMATIERYGECKIYASPGWWESTFAGVDWSAYSFVGQCDLWVAEYNVDAPKVMSPFVGWQIWQYGDHGTVAGAGTNDIDTDQWNGLMPR